MGPPRPRRRPLNCLRIPLSSGINGVMRSKIASVAVLILLVLAACTLSESKPSLVGTWSGTIPVFLIPITFVFGSDGTVSQSSAFGTATGTYTFDGSALHMAWSTGGTGDATVTFQGADQVTLTPTSGAPMVLTRQ